jgi:hypothetical protein
VSRIADVEQVKDLLARVQSEEERKVSEKEFLAPSLARVF